MIWNPFMSGFFTAFMDKWIADGCGNRIATLKSTGLLKEIEDAQRTATEMPQDLRRSLGLKSEMQHQHTDECWEPGSGCDMGRSEAHAVKGQPNE